MNKFIIFVVLVIGIIIGLSPQFIHGTNQLHVDFQKLTFDWIPKDSLSSTPEKIKETAIRRLNNVTVSLKRKITYEITDVRDGKIIFNTKNETRFKNIGEQATSEIIRVAQRKDEPLVEVQDDEGNIINPKTIPGEIAIREYTIPIPAGKEIGVVLVVQGKKEILPFKDIDVTLHPTYYSELFIEGNSTIISKLNINVEPITWFDNWERADPASTTSKSRLGWRTKNDGLFPFQGGFINIAIK